MALQLSTLIQETKDLYKLRIIAGKEGLYRTPQWLYLSEDIGNVGFLKGGELIIITGYSCQSMDLLMEYVQAVCNAKASGLIINTGKYIEEHAITGEIIDYCNVHAFPLITMPWEIHLADITQNFSKRIFEYNQRHVDISYLFTSFIDGEPVSLKEERRLADAGYPVNDTYTIAAFSNHNLTHSQQQIDFSITECLSRKNISASVFFYQDFHIILFHHMENTQIKEVLGEILDQELISLADDHFVLGLGCQVSMLSQLSRSFHTALEAIRIGKKQNKPCVSAFDDLGLYKLFFSVNDRELLRSYCTCLLPLIDYDAANDGNFMKTLYLYITYQGSIQKVAEELFCHRNTINYRMSKIKELLQMNLDHADAIFQIQLAFQILMYLGQYETMKSIS